MKSYQQFFAELKRRHVFKVAAIYGATAFVLLQLADLLVEALKLPGDFLTMITVLVLLGFPIALIVAWAFELGPAGVRRTDRASDEELAAIVAQPASQRWPAGLLALAGVAALVFGAWWVGRQTAPDSGEADPATQGPRLAMDDLAGDSRPSIAVMPFADMSPEGDQAYFGDGMTEELLNTLAKVRRLRVSGRTSTFAYRDASKDLRTIGDELGVRYIVEGSVRKDGDQLRITAQLIDASDGSHVWSEQYDRRLKNVFEIQTEIAQAIAGELQVPLGLADPTELVTPLADLEAYDLYLAGRSHLRERGMALNDAVRLFEAAIARDSGWAPAWAGLAEALEVRLWYDEGWEGPGPDSTEERVGLEEAERAARRALELDPRSASAHVALGSVLRDRMEWDDSERAYRQALSIDPDNAEAHQQYSELLLAGGRVAEAVKAAERAVTLDPAPIRYHMLAYQLVHDDRADEAKAVYALGIARDPEDRLPRMRGVLGWVHYVEGRYDEAYEQWSRIDPDLTREEFDAWAGYLQAGRLDAFPPEERQYLEAPDWLRIGEPDSAAADLAEIEPFDLDIQTVYSVWLPVYDSIRSHPRVQAFLGRYGLEGVSPQRTPPELREPPTVLRDAGTPISAGAGSADGGAAP